MLGPPRSSALRQSDVPSVVDGFAPILTAFAVAEPAGLRAEETFLKESLLQRPVGAFTRFEDPLHLLLKLLLVGKNIRFSALSATVLLGSSRI